MIQKLPAPEDISRVETGPVQFGDDWPGYFMRGDNAFALSMAIKSLLHGEEDFISRAQIESFLEDLDGAILK